MNKQPPTIKIAKNGSFRWINVKKPGKKEMAYIGKRFDLLEQDTKDCLPPLQRVRISSRPEYVFMILLFPVYDRRTREINISEIDLFISAKFIITVHNNELEPMVELDRLYRSGKIDKLLTDDPWDFLHEILHRLQNYCFPMLNHISHDIDEIKEKIFSGEEKQMVEEILITKRNIINFRKAMQIQKSVLQKIPSKTGGLLPTPAKKVNLYMSHVIEHVKDIWNILETHKESIDAFQDTNESLISFKLNTVMKTLTIISVVLMPANLVATLFGMNTQNMPYVGHPMGFWIILINAVILSMIMVLFLRIKKWM